MTRDGLPRAYLRIDPNLDQHYPELRSTFVGLLCAAGRQPERGRFRDRRLTEQLCGKAYVARAFDRGDLEADADGRVYVMGWDEWQEGDMTVAERMRRMRDRRKRVTKPPSPPRNAVTTDAPRDNSNVGTSGVGVDDSPLPPTSGGRRSEGTNPRSVAARLAETSERAERDRKERRRARHLAYLDGRLTEAQRADMDDRDASLEEVPAKRGAAYERMLA